MSEPIKITINDSDELTATGSVVADSVLYKRISFEFPEHWDNYLKTALFRNGDTAVDVILNADSPLFIEDNVYFIPHEVIKPPNFTVSVFGLSGTSTATSTPFGKYIAEAVKGTTEALFDTSKAALDIGLKGAGNTNGVGDVTGIEFSTAIGDVKNAG